MGIEPTLVRIHPQSRALPAPYLPNRSPRPQVICPARPSRAGPHYIVLCSPRAILFASQGVGGWLLSLSPLTSVSGMAGAIDLLMAVPSFHSMVKQIRQLLWMANRISWQMVPDLSLTVSLLSKLAVPLYLGSRRGAHNVR